MYTKTRIGLALVAGMVAMAVAVPAEAQSKARPRSGSGETKAVSQPQRTPPQSRPPQTGSQAGRREQPPAQPRAVPRTRPPADPGHRGYDPGRRTYRGSYHVWRGYYPPHYYYPWDWGLGWGWGGGWGRSYGFGWGVGYGSWPYQFYPPYPYYSYRGLAGSLRVQFQPKSAEVYVDGYYAGVVDDFDGFFQNLPIEPGGRDITVYQPGFRAFAERIYVQPHRTFKLRGALVPLAPGEPESPRPVPTYGPEPYDDPGEAPSPYPPAAQPPYPPAPRWPERDPGPPPEPGMSAPSTFGQVAIRVQPLDAEIFIDDEPWRGPQGAERLVVHLKPGLHRIEVRKEGFDPFVTTVDVKKGETTVLNVSLGRSSVV